MTVFEAVKQTVTARQAAENYGIDVNRAGKAKCPFHNDRTPSMKTVPGSGSQVLQGIIGLSSLAPALGMIVCPHPGEQSMASPVCGSPAKERPHRVFAGCAAVRTHRGACGTD